VLELLLFYERQGGSSELVDQWLALHPPRSDVRLRPMLFSFFFFNFIFFFLETKWPFTFACCR